MQIRVIQFGGGGRRGRITLGLLALTVGGVLLAFGLLLLAALAAGGIVAGAGAMLLRAFRGGRGAARSTLAPPDGWRAGLDPHLEVRPRDEASRLLPGDAGGR